MEVRVMSAAVPGALLPLLLLLLLLIGAVAPLKDARLVIPKAVKRHEDAVLRCDYDMEGDRLYQIKWYKNQHEFYRFTPGEKSPIKIFAVKGITVDTDRSNNRQVTLHKVEMSAEGRYACEVSADMPSFATSVIEDWLTVVEVPKRAPNISGLQSRYKIGDLLRANCTSEPSHPPANLTISINGQQYVPREHVTTYNVKREKDDSIRKRKVVGVEFILQPEHFGTDNKLKIRCSAIIFDVYNMVDERSVELRLPNVWPPSVLETNQPPQVPPYDQDPYGEFDQRRPRYPEDNAAPAGCSVSVRLAALLLLATVVLR